MELSTEAIEAARAKLRERCGETGQRLGGKGTARRKTKKVHKSTVGDDKKLTQTIKRIGASNIPGIEEVQMMRDDGKIMSFTNPKVQASPNANTYIINGHCVEKDGPPISENIAQFIQTLKKNPEALQRPDLLKKLQEFESSGPFAVAKGFGDDRNPSGKKEDNKKNSGSKKTAKDRADGDEDDEDDDDLPDLVEDFEDVSKS